MPKPLYWRIRGHEGFTVIFERTVEVGQFTDDQIKHLLQALTAKAGLSFSDIVGAYARRRTKIANDLLAIHNDVRHSTLTCGSDPVFTASVVDEKGKLIIHPPI